MRILSTVAVLAALMLMAPPCGFAGEDEKNVTLAFEDTDVKEVIAFIAKAGGLNVIVSPEVKGTISVSITDVPAQEALRHVAKAVGLSVSQADNGVFLVQQATPSFVPYTKAKRDVEYRAAIAALQAKAAIVSARLDQARAALEDATHAAVPGEMQKYQREVEFISTELVKIQREIMKAKDGVSADGGKARKLAEQKKVATDAAKALAELEPSLRHAGKVTAGTRNALRKRLAEVEAQKEKALALRDRLLGERGDADARAELLKDEPAGDGDGLVTTIYDVRDLTELGWREKLVRAVAAAVPHASWGLTKKNLLTVQATKAGQARVAQALIEMRVHAKARAAKKPGGRVTYVDGKHVVTSKPTAVTKKKSDAPFTPGVVTVFEHVPAGKGKDGATIFKLVPGTMKTTTTKSGKYRIEGSKPGTYSFGVVPSDALRAKAMKRYEDLKAAADHLKAAGLFEESKRIYAQARQAYAAAQPKYVMDRGSPGVLHAVHALRRDVGALRGEVRQLTALVRSLLAERRAKPVVGIGGGTTGSFRGRPGSGGAGGAPGKPGEAGGTGGTTWER